MGKWSLLCYKTLTYLRIWRRDDGVPTGCIACLGKVETAEDFEAAYADSQCHAYRQCNRMIFDGKYDGMADCQDKVQNNLPR